MNSALILAQVFSCCFLTGVIWIVQILIYPNFKFVGKTEFQNFHNFHTNRITWIVAPLMGMELFSAIALLLSHQNALYLYNLISILLIWGLTGFVNIPSHRNLTFEVEKTKQRLVACNWLRTIVWSLRSLFWLWMINEMLNVRT